MARRLVFGLLLALLIATPAAGHGIHAQKERVDAAIAGLHGKIAVAQQREGALEQEIAAVTTRIRELERQVGDVSARLATLEHDLALHRERLDRLNQLFELQTRRLTFLRQQYRVSVHRLNDRLVEIYESADTTPLEVVLSAGSFADLLDGLDYLNRVGAQDKRIASEVSIAKADVRAAREGTRRTRAGVAVVTRTIAVRATQVRDVRDRLLANRGSLSDSRSQRRQALDSLKGRERDYASEIDALSKVSAQLAERIRAAQAAAAAASSASTGGGSPSGFTPVAGGLSWPVSGPVVSPYGWRWGRIHEGIDIAVPSGTTIAAAASGTVIYAGWLEGYGNLVVVDHGGGLATAYAHESAIAVGGGQVVTQGQALGYVGCTGHCFGPHLHFEVRVNGAAVDPLGYL